MVATSRRTPRLNAAPRVMSMIEFSGKESRVRRRGRYDRLRMGERVEGYRSEPSIIKTNADTVAVLVILDDITRSVAAAGNRRSDGFRVLRQALGYGWSVAAAAAPQNAKPYVEKWLRSTDKDVAWVMKTNLNKSRMEGLRKSLEATASGRRASVRAKPAARRASPAKRKPAVKRRAAAKPAKSRAPKRSTT